MQGASFPLDSSAPSSQTSVSSPSPAPLLVLALVAYEAAENDNLGIYAEEQLRFKEDQKQYLKNALTGEKNHVFSLGSPSPSSTSS